MQSILQITNYHPLLGNMERVKRKRYDRRADKEVWY